MKKIKKLSVVVVALAMCLLLGVTAWAANSSDVTYTATLEGGNTLCITGEAQEITLTVKTNKTVDVDSISATVVLPDGWGIASIANDTLTFAGNDYNLETGEIVWYSGDTENKQTDTLAVIKVTVPANVVAGNYSVGLEDIALSSDYGTPWEDGASVTATVTVKDHEWNEPTYSIDAENGKHTANYTCKNDATHTKSDAPVEHTYNQTGDKCVCGAEKPAPAGVKGDVNLDGVVTAADLTALARHLGGMETLTDATATFNADTNGDGIIAAADLTALARHLGGMETLPNSATPSN